MSQISLKPFVEVYTMIKSSVNAINRLKYKYSARINLKQTLL